MLLAIDTSLGTSVAVVDHDGGVLCELSDPSRENHADVIGSLIEKVLQSSGTDPAALSGVAVGMGPGTWGSLAVGLATARGFAVALRKPVVRVVSHDAAAVGRTQPSILVSRSSDGDRCWSVYGGLDSELGLPLRVTEPTRWDSENPAIPTEYARHDRVIVTEISAGALGMLAERLFMGKRAFARKEPYYFRAPE